MRGPHHHGRCHCGALAVVFSSRVEAEQLPVRACQCRFCRAHGARNTADPLGRVVFMAREPERLSRYRFGLGSADFLVCARCGVYVGALLENDGRAYATINVNALEDAAAFAPGQPVSYEGETVAARITRRIQRWTPAARVTRRRTRSDAPEAARLVGAYLEELARVLGGFDPQRSVSADPEEMAGPSGSFVVLADGERPVACGGLKTHADGVGELKRMFVAPEARGRHLGLALLTELEDEARRLGMKRVVLDTAAPLAPARGLYLAAGYEEVAPFNQNPYAAHWFAKAL